MYGRRNTRQKMKLPTLIPRKTRSPSEKSNLKAYGKETNSVWCRHDGGSILAPISRPVSDQCLVDERNGKPEHGRVDKGRRGRRETHGRMQCSLLNACGTADLAIDGDTSSAGSRTRSARSRILFNPIYTPLNTTLGTMPVMWGQIGRVSVT